MPSATLRRTGAARAADPLFGGCTLHVPSARRPLTACQELPPTAAATPHLHALVAVPPLPRVPARAPAARRLAIAEQCLLLSGLGSELGAGFRAGGRAVNLGCKRLLSKEKIETCRALSKRGRRKTVVCRGMMLPAHALLKQASSQGVIAARADLQVHVPRSAGALLRCGARGVDTVGPDASQNARVSQGGGVSHLRSRRSHQQGSRWECECVLATPIGCFSVGTARDPRAGMRAEAYRSMADERGQV